MLKSEELIDELIATLHFHNYLKMESTNAFGGEPLNVVANEHRIENIQNYIDDLYVDYFFRTHNFKPIVIPEGWNIQVYTKEGRIDSKGGIELNLSNPFDRYTFVYFITNSVLDSCGELSRMYPDNNFLKDIIILSMRVGPIWECPNIKFQMPNGDEFEQYLCYLHDLKHSMYNPLIRSREIVNYSELYSSKLYQHCYKGLTSQGMLCLEKRHHGYRDLRDIKLFGEYSLEDILLIYCLLIYKFKMAENNLLAFIGLFVSEDLNKESFLYDFYEFENHTTNIELIKPFVRDRDLFLRFTSVTMSKAVKFQFASNGIAKIQFFNEEPIPAIFMDNSLPLPFLHNELF